ncbi:MAG: aminotransferase class III-fold pyridoxal phosphate-dependent enzyme [Bacteroidetes bacterium]|nr:aminotransferase class III-fold pyridoxal phosphate-dependent enzyme [Bacteroidota bacterium]
MSDLEYSKIRIEQQQAAYILSKFYNITGQISDLPGELDFNFKIKTSGSCYVLKISRPNIDIEFIDFQYLLLKHLEQSSAQLEVPQFIKNKEGVEITKYTDASGMTRWVRLYTWLDGRLWSSVYPHTDQLLFSLGKESGLITHILSEFDHPSAHRKLDWDISQGAWTYEFTNLFEGDIKGIITSFQKRFSEILPQLENLRKGVIHNDVNDHNIIVSDNLSDPRVKAIIDYGDAIYTAQINNLAVTIAYAVMGKPDPLQAALPVVKGYHENIQLQEEELVLLYLLVAMRLVISITKSAINKSKEPENEYLLVSEKPAIELLTKWHALNEDLAIYSFRKACSFSPHPNEAEFTEWRKKNIFQLEDLFPSLSPKSTSRVDMSVSSTWLGNAKAYSDNALTTSKLKKLKENHPDSIIAGGYGETRPFYTSDIFKKEGNNGPEYRTVHLGVDYWVEKETPVHAIFPGTIFSIHNNEGDKDYGPTLIIEHVYNNDHKFYTLYGHLSRSSLQLFNKGDQVRKGELIAFIGDESENGNWSPHLHFQLMLDMLGNTIDFPGVAFPSEFEIWQSICPDPNLLFNSGDREKRQPKEKAEAIEFRKEHLGENLSLSYKNPLKIVRGEGEFLIDETGRKYLDTVNNVAHVGHEHSRVVEAGQKQMAVLNTNTRYLHDHIIEFAHKLLSTFPKELSVVYFLNSGSEANELALRMARIYKGQKDMVAVEAGYHGNTNACIEVSSYKFDGDGGQGCPEHTHIVPLPDIFRGIYQGADAGRKYASHVKKQVENIQYKGRNVAAFICESIISCGGQIELPKNYLKTAYKEIREAGGVCIADEVQVGCGRVGSAFWGFQLHDVVPDIVTIGKPIGNGHPLAAVVCTKKVADAFANGMEYFNTFGGNPVSCAIGKEVLQVIEDENLQGNALLVGNYLKDQLKALQKEFPIIGDVRGQGLFLGFELNGKDKEPLGEKASYLANKMQELAILMSTDGPDHNVIKIKPPMVFSKQNADELIYRLSMVLKEDFMRLIDK